MPDQTTPTQTITQQGLAELYAYLGGMTHRAFEAEAQLAKATEMLRQLHDTYAPKGDEAAATEPTPIAKSKPARAESGG